MTLGYVASLKTKEKTMMRGKWTVNPKVNSLVRAVLLLERVQIHARVQAMCAEMLLK